MAKSLFNLPPTRSSRSADASATKKATGVAAAAPVIKAKGKGSIVEIIATINAVVGKYLYKYENDYEAIRSDDELIKYVDNLILSDEISIDTETTSLDPITGTIVGFSLYAPGLKAVYVPLNHISYITGAPSNNQVSMECATSQFKRISDSGAKIIMFNAKFDVRFISNQLGVKLDVFWDGYLAQRCLNENEGAGNNGLKALHKKYVSHSEDEAFSFDKLFEGISFNYIPIKTGYLYAAHDARITYDLYKFQEPFLDPNNEVCQSRGLQDVAYVFHEIEMKMVPVLADMEDTGIAIDLDYAATLSEKYHKLRDEWEQKYYSLLKTYNNEINSYRLKTPGNKLSDPVSISSPTQLAILFYNIFKQKQVYRDRPRAVDEGALQAFNHPLSELILKYRETDKILSTYVDKLPNNVNNVTGRIHCKFNSIGADTGRMSCNDPNLQNIPSHNKEIRKMFVASPGYVLLSSDYSAQEPRITAHMSNDQRMIEAYQQGKDVYSEIASLAFNQPYEECREFRSDGTLNPAGKERRSSAKTIVLGVCYGRGIPSIAEQLGVSNKEGQKIYDSVMRHFPGLKQFTIDSESMARNLGYVTTVWGRRRRLPAMQLPKYEFSWIGGVSKDFDPMFDDNDEDTVNEVSPHLISKYTHLLDRTWSGVEKFNIRNKAKEEGINIVDNGGKIADATRQCVNARIQGSAADMCKRAMVKLHACQELKDLGFRLLVPVHDEIIAECPELNRKRCAELLTQCMIEAGAGLRVPFKCDCEASYRWYGEGVDL